MRAPKDFKCGESYVEKSGVAGVVGTQVPGVVFELPPERSSRHDDAIDDVVERGNRQNVFAGELAFLEVAP
jgi:hypothetical protein